MKASHAYSSAKFFADDKDLFNKVGVNWRKREGNAQLWSVLNNLI
jgi:hypothetical protein